MSLYTERHGMRTPIEKTPTISIDMYLLLLDCCEKYHENLAWKYPDECPDGRGCCGLNFRKMDVELKFRIPNLYRNEHSGAITSPRENGEFDQYALLDYIEFFAQNIADISRRTFHSYFCHDDLSFADTTEVFYDFRKDINEIFKMTGLLYSLTEEKIIERVTDNDVLTANSNKISLETADKSTRELIEEAIVLFRQPRPQDQQKAVEKIWDALESLKTHFPGIEKKRFDDKLANILANGQNGIEPVFKKELSELGNIGNNYSIRHFNNTQIEITDTRHYDYFFNRCLSLIALAVKYLPQKVDVAVEEEELPF
ncbi:MAG: hypothetical protein FWH04_08635 [Oscillospiraceae bacterium]|nr:hypothetical protein [Oscillospiraceae bacterium]